MNATMEFLQNYKDKRENPSTLLPNGSQAIIFGLNYFQGDRWGDVRAQQSLVAQYARLKDYHKVMKLRAEKIIGLLAKEAPELNARVLVDSAPILERALANKTARGFIGKNTCFIHPEKGSFFLLGEILLDQILVPEDEKKTVDAEKRTKEGGCGSCKRCQVYCPTGALDEAYRLDARKCIAYWTIEHRGPIPLEFWPHLKTYLFGCDICQVVCPYNRAAVISSESRSLVSQLDLYDVATMTQESYVSLFGGSPATRAKRSGLRRNALIALYEKKDLRLKEALENVKDNDESVLVETKNQILNLQN